MNTDIAMCYASHDGQTRKLALYLADKLMDQGLLLTLDDLNATQPSPEDISEAGQLILIAPVRYGYHLPAMEAFVNKNRSALEGKPLVLVSLNLTARKDNKNTPETNPYMRKWVKKLGLHPDLQAVFAGKLNYALYPWWEKQIIRLIMKITGGPTNLDANIDFTRWDRVEALALQVASSFKERRRENAA